MILACSFSVSDLEDEWYQHKQLCRKTYFLSYLCRQELWLCRFLQNISPHLHCRMKVCWVCPNSSWWLATEPTVSSGFNPTLPRLSTLSCCLLCLGRGNIFNCTCLVSPPECSICGMNQNHTNKNSIPNDPEYSSTWSRTKKNNFWQERNTVRTFKQNVLYQFLIFYITILLFKKCFKGK